MAIFIHIWNGGEDWKTPNSYRLCQNWELGRKSSPVNVVISGTGMEVVTLPIPQAHLEWDRLLPDSNLHALSCRNSCHMHPALPRQQDKRRKLKPFGEGGKGSGNSRRKQRYCGKKTRIQWWGKCKDPQKAQIPPQRGKKKKNPNQMAATFCSYSHLQILVALHRQSFLHWKHIPSVINRFH